MKNRKRSKHGDHSGHGVREDDEARTRAREIEDRRAESGIDRPRSDEELSRRSAHRTNPPLSDDALGDGGISSSGGVAGGARGGAGTSSSGAGTPEGYEKAGPGEQKSTSRFDLDRGTLDVPEE